jgi:DNA repair protein RadD
MARPLRKSMSEHVQLLGRGLRIADGKYDCLVLDHSGNMRRFWVACEHFFEHGIEKLDDGKKPDKKEVKKEKTEAEPVTCPSCKSIHAPMPHCPSCGHEYPRKQAVQHVPGTLQELIAGGHHKKLDQDLFPQIAGYVLERREGDAARRMAQALYRDMTGEFALVAWENVKPVQPSAEVRNRIRAQQIRFAKGRAKAEARAAA